MRVLIFDNCISGHHLEYLHYLHIGASQREDCEYVFCVPKALEKAENEDQRIKTSNIRYHFIAPEVADSFNSGNMYQRGWCKSRYIVKTAKELSCTHVFLVMLMEVFPFVLWGLPKNIKLSGIIYSIFLYDIGIVSSVRTFVDKLRYRIMSMSSKVGAVFILNDNDSTAILNRMFATKKFKFLPDPVPQVNLEEVHNVRKELGIPEDNKVFLHFGGLSDRKGTGEILKAIVESPPQYLENKTFIFAGVVSNDLKPIVKSLLPQAAAKAQVLFFDGFCKKELLFNLCFSCDVILAPYKITSLSSGLLGYASVFGKPVVGPSNGLIGQLIMENNMGGVLNSIDAHSIYMSFIEDFPKCSAGYSSNRTSMDFYSTVISGL